MSSWVSLLVHATIQMPKKSQNKRRGGDEEAVPPKWSKDAHTDEASSLCFQSPKDLFESLIQPLKSEQFFSEFWEKKPLHLQRFGSDGPSFYHTLFQLSDLESLCSEGLEYYRDVNLVRCVNGKKKVLNKKGKVKHGALTTNLIRNKASIQFHQPQRFKDELWKIQEKLECFFGALVGSNIYITPEDSQALPAHYDDVEVFILQLEGEKHWRLYNPTVPLAAEYSIESEQKIGRPTHDIILKMGDLLYFPRGTIHQAETPPGVVHSTHLTLSTYQRMAWGDLLLDTFPSFLFDCCRTKVHLREGIPRRFLLESSESLETRRQLAATLRIVAEKMESGMLEIRSTHMKKDFIMNRLPPYCQQQHLTPSGPIPALEDTVSLCFKDHMIITVEASQQGTDQSTELVVFVLHSLKNSRKSHMMGEVQIEEVDWKISKGLQFPLSHLQAVQQLQDAELLPLKQLKLPTDVAKLNLALALWSESLLHVI
ncbi:ribosomal oxygenase 2 isoform X2 [Gouania willdenowi]|uniref:ribosomal oxygenase 2 isoform X2 n=1 Tax=Gouania willdenowi TaxID=441366 RepID=UPI001054D231|nr:ribosomal oxygenase 2 isoform X2 [Gouania willdenowi]